MKDLFRTSVPNINMHLRSIFNISELEEEATIKDFLMVQKEGAREVKRKQIFYNLYNLDAIISVGYRIKSHAATKFRQWATKHIREYIVNGFLALNDREILSNASLISHELAKETAYTKAIHICNYSLSVEILWYSKMYHVSHKLTHSQNIKKVCIANAPRNNRIPVYSKK